MSASANGRMCDPTHDLRQLGRDLIELSTQMHFRNIDVVVFNAMGVTFVEGDDVSNLLIPFVARECGCTNREAIRKLYLPASLGRISSQEFWARLAQGLYLQS